MTDQESFLIAIRAEPDDDTRRLAYADWLDEHDEPVRAKLIRLQIRIAALQRDCWCGACIKLRGGGQHHNGPCTVDRERDELPDGRSQQAFLRKQERELWIGGQCNAWLTDEYLGAVSLDAESADLLHGIAIGIVRRGFVDEVRCMLSQWMGEACPPHTRETGHSGHSADCTQCHGSGHIPGIAKAVMAAHPVTTVRVTDREPVRVGGTYRWYDEDILNGVAVGVVITGADYSLPHQVFTELGSGDFGSPALAHAALSRVAVSWGKAEAKKKEKAT